MGVDLPSDEEYECSELKLKEKNNFRHLRHFRHFSSLVDDLFKTEETRFWPEI